MYCIYSGKEIDDSKSTVEHIIPLSLGGSNDFTINVSEKYNNLLGSRVDGKMTQDFLTSLDRVNHGDKGHSKKIPKVNIKSKIENKKPAITSFTKNNMTIFDPINKKYIDVPHKLTMKVPFDLDIRIKFTTKVSLATGYYLFGDKFTQYSDCNSLRNIMMSENLKETLKKADNFEGIRFFDPLITKKACEKDTMFQIYKLFIERSNESSVVWSFSEESFIVFVAIYGKFIGMLNFKAVTDKFPKTGDFWLGHTLICQNGKLRRMSWRDTLIEICEKTGILDEDIINEAKKFKGDFNP